MKESQKAKACLPEVGQKSEKSKTEDGSGKRSMKYEVRKLKG